MARHRKRQRHVSPFYGFGVSWLLMSIFLPLYRIWALLLTAGVSAFVAYMLGLNAANKEKAQEMAKEQEPVRKAQPQEVRRAQPKAKKSYGPEIDPIVEEGDRALGEMGRLYTSISDPEIKRKINELMRITDKIKQDAIEDPSDIPQIKKFMKYYLPSTIKLLNAYDRMSSQGIEGENLDKSMNSINEMLDVAIDAFKKRLDSLFSDQALDIETDIDVLNQMLAREGLTGEKDFQVQTGNSK